ncbi:phage holin family protein [Thioalkalivibrio sp. XN279]|jgi:putative membrane protein|uniref:phage holin family protein n=1 Tax=Thioalkalivibrio sp. XN279 TaxID=2714953 RepID=UPI00140D9B89|nr:phage holin family protein [Thioalkalivibrio sp. XN279]NHA15837.1 phage holin family protein [Thioalkalivibrio sp. XN279]
MNGFLVRMLITAISLWLAALVVPGMHLAGFGTVLGAALVLGIVNAFVRPIVILLTLPLTILTLGLFLLVVNAMMLGLVSAMFSGFSISGFWSAIFGAIFVSFFSWLASAFIGPSGRYEVMVVRRD